jgi:hypothetical protein
MARSGLRGILAGVVDPPGPRRWQASLLQTEMVWYEPLVNVLDPELDCRNGEIAYVRRLKKEHKEYFDRRFVYFLCSRPRVRFSTTRPARISRITGKLLVWLEVGPKRTVHRLSLKAPAIFDTDRDELIPLRSVSNTATLIDLEFADGDTRVIHVHRFLLQLDVGPKHATQVHYVGLTRNPDTRVLNGEHQGLARTLYRREEGRDILVFFHAFAVRSLADDEEHGIRYVVSNAMSGEVDIDTEGLVLETALISYFKPDAQGDQKNEEARFRNLMATLGRTRRITSLEVILAYPEPRGYYAFGSAHVAASAAHHFVWNAAGAAAA